MKRLVTLFLCLALPVALSAQRAEQKPESDEGKAKAHERVEQDHAPQHKKQVEEEPTPPEKREVAEASQKLRQAILDRDADQLRQLMAINYQLIGSMGRSIDRTDAINFIVFQMTDFDVVDTDIQGIQVEGDTASETGNAYIRGSFRGELFSTTYRYVRHWQRENGQWKLVSTNIQGLGGVF
jgi:ketosteroid isomerase-like protein